NAAITHALSATAAAHRGAAVAREHAGAGNHAAVSGERIAATADATHARPRVADARTFAGVAGGARPIRAGRVRAVQRALSVGAGERVVIVDLAHRRIGLMVGHAVFVRQIVDDRRVGAGRSRGHQACQIVRDQPTDAVVPRPLPDARDGVDLLAVF